METLRIRAGDLVIGSNGYDLISGQPKDIQDLGIILREPFGSDRFHPRWGSLLPNYIGSRLDSFVRLRVEAEIQRLVINYISTQADRLTSDARVGNPSRFTTDEVIASIQGIDATPDGDRLKVTVLLKTLSSAVVQLNTTVGGG
jgi:phage baseplate assembly protein W